MADRGEVILGEVMATETRPRPWKKPLSLKEMILESRDPRMNLYKELLELFPNLGEGRIRELLQVDRWHLEKCLRLIRATKRKELLDIYAKTSLDDRLVKRFDAMCRYWFYLIPRFEEERPELREDYAITWNYSLDGTRYSGRIFLSIDDKAVPLQLFESRFGPYSKPIIGASYESFPCFKATQDRIKEKIKNLSQKSEIMETDLHELENLIRVKDRLKAEIFQIHPDSLVPFEPRFTKDLIYLHRLERPCSICQRGKHVFWIVLKLKRKIWGGVRK